eukprot:SAG22_NODE_524_length_9488_cov_16.150602_9_plen_680_part_00
MGERDGSAEQWRARNAVVNAQVLEDMHDALPTPDEVDEETWEVIRETAAHVQMSMRLTASSQAILAREQGNFECPISCLQLCDPVMAEDGYLYERYHIQKWIDRCRRTTGVVTSPMTREPMGINLTFDPFLTAVLASQRDREFFEQCQIRGECLVPPGMRCAVNAICSAAQQSVHVEGNGEPDAVVLAALEDIDETLPAEDRGNAAGFTDVHITAYLDRRGIDWFPMVRWEYEQNMTRVQPLSCIVHTRQHWTAERDKRMYGQTFFFLGPRPAGLNLVDVLEDPAHAQQVAAMRDLGVDDNSIRSMLRMQALADTSSEEPAAGGGGGGEPPPTAAAAPEPPLVPWITNDEWIAFQLQRENIGVGVRTAEAMIPDWQGVENFNIARAEYFEWRNPGNLDNDDQDLFYWYTYALDTGDLYDGDEGYCGETLFELDIDPIGAAEAPTLAEFNDDDDFDDDFRQQIVSFVQNFRAHQRAAAPDPPSYAAATAPAAPAPAPAARQQVTCENCGDIGWSTDWLPNDEGVFLCGVCDATFRVLDDEAAAAPDPPAAAATLTEQQQLDAGRARFLHERGISIRIYDNDTAEHYSLEQYQQAQEDYRGLLDSFNQNPNRNRNPTFYAFFHRVDDSEAYSNWGDDYGAVTWEGWDLHNFVEREMDEINSLAAPAQDGKCVLIPLKFSRV